MVVEKVLIRDVGQSDVGKPFPVKLRPFVRLDVVVPAPAFLAAPKNLV